MPGLTSSANFDRVCAFPCSFHILHYAIDVECSTNMEICNQISSWKHFFRISPNANSKFHISVTSCPKIYKVVTEMWNAHIYSNLAWRKQYLRETVRCQSALRGLICLCDGMPNSLMPFIESWFHNRLDFLQVPIVCVSLQAINQDREHFTNIMLVKC